MNDYSKNEVEQKPKNAFNDIDLFLGLLLATEIYILCMSYGEMLELLEDRSPHIAGLVSVLLIMTIYHFIKRKKNRST